MGAKTSKRYSSLKSLLNPFKLLLKFLLSGPHKSTVLDFWNLGFLIFQEFCSFSLTYDPMGAKTLLLPQITLESFQTFSWILFSVVLTKVLFWIFEILSFRFLTNFWISPLHPMGKPKTSIIWKTSDRRAKPSEIWASGVSIQCTQGTFDT